MLNIRSSKAGKINPEFRKVPRPAGQDNVAWLEGYLKPLKATGDRTHVVLIGGTSAMDVRLRMAQAHARNDLTPSHWSHALLLEPHRTRMASTVAHETSLDPAGGFGAVPAHNAVQQTSLRAYADPRRFPNVAVISVPVAWEKVDGHLQRFKAQRAVLDGVELLLLWLAYGWGVGRAGNPLLDGHGFPSAAMIEYLFAAAGFELTPGLASRSSCPEAIWQSARWWHEYYGREGVNQGLGGAWHTEHYLVPGK